MRILLSNNDYGLRDQIRRTAGSIMSNVAEGFARRTDKDFSRFLYIALGSVSEVQSHLYVALDLEYIKKNEFTECYKGASDTAKLVLGFIKYLSDSDDRSKASHRQGIAST